jgi:predicted PurR-regulated permease PerM
MFALKQQRLVQILLLLLIALASLALLWLLWQGLQFFGGAVLIFFTAWLISFILGPVVGWAQRRGLSRLAASILVYVALLALIAVLVVVLAPVMADQIGQIAKRIAFLTTPAQAAKLGDSLVSLLKQFGMPAHQARQTVDQLGARLSSSVHSALTGSLSDIAGVLSSVAAILLDAVIALVLSFYMTLDGRRLMESLILRLPVAWRDDARTLGSHVARVFGGFIRSELIIGLSYGILTWIIVWALGVPIGLIVGLISGIIFIIPFVGPFLAIVPPMALILLEISLDNVVRTEAILVIALFLAQQLVMQVLAPRIISAGVGLHPVWLFAALLIGARVAGVWGAFFAPPFAALIAVAAGTLMDRFAADNPLYAEPVPADGSTSPEHERPLAEALDEAS